MNWPLYNLCIVCERFSIGDTIEIIESFKSNRKHDDTILEKGLKFIVTEIDDKTGSLVIKGPSKNKHRVKVRNFDKIIKFEVTSFTFKNLP